MNTEKNSMSDCAYNYLSKKKKAKSFYEIWDNVVAELEISEEEQNEVISYFYTNLTLDSRFVNVGENKWDLRERLPFEKVHIDMNDIYNDEEEMDEDDLLEDDAEDEDSLDEDFDSYEDKDNLERAKFDFDIDSDEEENN